MKNISSQSYLYVRFFSYKWGFKFNKWAKIFTLKKRLLSTIVHAELSSQDSGATRTDSVIKLSEFMNEILFKRHRFVVGRDIEKKTGFLKNLDSTSFEGK